MIRIRENQSSVVALNKMADDGIRLPLSPRATLRRWVMALIAAGGLSLGSAAQAADVKTNVGGAADTKIGELTTASGPAGDTDHFTATFTLDAAYSYLDDWYDFRWVQILASLTVGGVAQANHPLVGAIPAIDPAPSDNPAGNEDGPAPFYYNGKEWKEGKFSGEVIAKNGEFSKLSDSPQLAAGTVATFNSYLVAHDVTNNVGSKSFCVLAGFSWTYTGGTAGNAGEDTSTAGAALPGGAAAAMAINTAMGNASVGGDFMGWTAEADCALFACAIGLPKWFSLASAASVPPGVPIVGHVSTSPIPSSPPIEIVSLTLQGSAPLILQGNDSVPGTAPGNTMEYFVTTQAPINLPPETVIPGGLRVELAPFQPGTTLEVVPQADGLPYYTSFRPGDSFFDIFVETICNCPGGPIPQTWVVSVELPDNVDGTFSAMSVAFSSGLVLDAVGGAPSFFDVFTEITFAGGETFLPGEHIANISIASTVVPLPAPLWAGLAGLAGLAISRRRMQAA